jgi:hypothetical protein
MRSCQEFQETIDQVVIAVTALAGLVTEAATTGFQVRLKHEGCHVDDRNDFPTLAL